MGRPNSARSYFERVYPLLRGTRRSPLSGWTRRWTEPGQPERLEWVLSQLEGEPPLRVLDAGCGEGVHTVALAALGHQVTALDFSRAMLQATRARARAAGVGARVDTRLADLRDWTPAERFDVLLCLGVVEYYEDSGALLARLFGFASDRMLVSLTRAEAGPRRIVRRLWLSSQGVPCRFYHRDDLAAVLAPLGAARVQVRNTRSTHCVTAFHYPVPGSRSAVAACHRNGAVAAWPGAAEQAP